jgi:hypothetical protein
MAEEQQQQGRDATSRRQGDRYLLSSDDIRTFHTNGYVHLKVQCRFLMLPWLLAAAASAHEVSFISFLISVFFGGETQKQPWLCPSASSKTVFMQFSLQSHCSFSFPPLAKTAGVVQSK